MQYSFKMFWGAYSKIMYIQILIIQNFNLISRYIAKRHFFLNFLLILQFTVIFLQKYEWWCKSSFYDLIWAVVATNSNGIRQDVCSAEKRTYLTKVVRCWIVRCMPWRHIWTVEMSELSADKCPYLGITWPSKNLSEMLLLYHV